MSTSFWMLRANPSQENKPYDVSSPEDEAFSSEIHRLPSLDVELDLDESEGGHTPPTGTRLDDSPRNFGRGFVRGIWAVGTTLYIQAACQCCHEENKTSEMEMFYF